MEQNFEKANNTLENLSEKGRATLANSIKLSVSNVVFEGCTVNENQNE